MDFGAIAQGLGQLGPGLNQGLDISARIQAMQAAQRQQQARQAVGRSYMGGPAPQPPMPGAPSLPGGGPAPAPPPGMDPGLMALPTGGAPPPPMAAPPPPMAAPPMEMEGPAFQTQAAPGPAAEPSPAPAAGLGGDPLSGVAAPGGDAVKDAQSTIMSIAQTIKQANPDITPEQLFDATQLQIETMKGVRNDVKDYMMAQIELAKVQTRVQTTQMRVEAQRDVAETQAGARVDAAEIGADSRENVAGIQTGGRVRSAEIGADSRRDVASTQAGARVDAAGIGADSRRDVAATNRDASDYRADQGYRRGVDSAQAVAGKKPSTRPGPRYRNERFSTNGRGAGRGGGGSRPQAYKSAEDVRAAFQSGKISQQEAVRMLERDFGIK